MTGIMWSVHNLLAHPLSEAVYLLGFGSRPARDLANWIHDVTVPAHEPGTGRG